MVSHYFPPEIGAPQARLSELARHWSEAGEEVVVLTGMPNHPTGVVPPAYRRRARVRERVDGYEVLRTWLYATPNEGMARKTLGHLSFMVTSVVLGWRASGPADVVMVSSPTFLSIFSAWLLARAKRAAFVVEVRDLWPAIFVELGVLTNRWLIKALETAELAAYRAADAVVVVSEGFREDLVRRGVPAAKVHTVRNGVDVERFSPLTPAPEALRSRLGAGAGDTLVVYVGAHGISHGLETVVEAAAMLQGEPVRVALVGEGATKAKVKARAAQLGVTNVTFLAGVPRAEVAGLLAAADICLVPLRDIPLFSTFIPSKLFEYLAAGKAVIGSLRGEAADILAGAGALVVGPQDPDALARAISSLAADPARRAAMGRAGRAYVVEHFDRRHLAAGYLGILREAVANSRGRTAHEGRHPMVGVEKEYSDIRRLVCEIQAVWKVADRRSAARWTVALLRRFPKVVKSRSFIIADQALAGSQGSFKLPSGIARVVVPGEHFGGAREMYCRAVYFRRPGFRIHPGEIVVDLGANRGLFSILAATEGANVVAVEAGSGFLPVINAHATLNNCNDRIKVLNALVTPGTGLLSTREGRMKADHWGTEPESVRFGVVIDRYGLRRIDFLKIDIEGSEFDLFRDDDLDWLDIVEKVAMEVHPQFGDVGLILDAFTKRGFSYEQLDNDGHTVHLLQDGGYVFAKRKPLDGQWGNGVEVLK